MKSMQSTFRVTAKRPLQLATPADSRHSSVGTAAPGDRLQSHKQRIQNTLKTIKDAYEEIAQVWEEVCQVCTTEEQRQLEDFFQHDDNFVLVSNVQPADRALCRKIRHLWSEWPWNLSDSMPSHPSHKLLTPLHVLAQSCSRNEGMRLINEAYDQRNNRREEYKEILNRIPSTKELRPWDMARALTLLRISRRQSTTEVANESITTVQKPTGHCSPRDSSVEAETMASPFLDLGANLIATRKRKRQQVDTPLNGRSSKTGIASHSHYRNEPDTPVRSIEVGRSCVTPLARIDEDSFEQIHIDVDADGFDDDGASDHDGSCDHVEESSLVMELPSLTVRSTLDGASEDFDKPADCDGQMIDDVSPVDSNLHTAKHPGLDGEVSCDLLNATKDKPLCTRESPHIIESDVFDGPPEEVSLAQRLSSNLQIAIANLQPCQRLTDTAISSILNLVPQVLIQVLDGSYLSHDNYCATSTGRLRIKDGVRKIVIPVPLKHPSLHWCLGVFDLELKTITLYNSWPHEQYSAVARSILMRCGEHISRQNTQHEGPWKWHEALRFPQQDNGWDCGVFILVAAIHIMLDMSLPTIIDGTLWRSLLLTLVNRAGDAQMPQACTSAFVSVSLADEVKDEIDFAKLQSSISSIDSLLDNLQAIFGVIRAVLGQVVIQTHKRSADRDPDSYIRTLDAFSSSQGFAQIPAEHTASLMASLTRTRAGLVARSKDTARQREYCEFLTKVWNAGVDFVDSGRSKAMQSKWELDKMMTAHLESEEMSIASLQAGLDRRKEAFRLAAGTRPAGTRHS